jgi:hypothetical protein
MMNRPYTIQGDSSSLFGEQQKLGLGRGFKNDSKMIDIFN